MKWNGERFFRAVKGFIILKWLYSCLILQFIYLYGYVFLLYAYVLLLLYMCCILFHCFILSIVCV